MALYSRHRRIPVTTSYVRSLVGGNRRGDKNKETAEIGEKPSSANGLIGGATALEGRKGRPCSRAPGLTRPAQARWFAKGPVHIHEVAHAASKGGHAVVVWLAVRARMDSANGAPATTTWIAKATGLGERAVRKAVVALISIGMLKRDGSEISLPSYMQE